MPRRPPAPRLWNSAVWMRQKYLVQKMSPEDIAKEAGCSLATIYRKIEEFGLLR